MYDGILISIQAIIGNNFYSVFSCFTFIISSAEFTFIRIFIPEESTTEVDLIWGAISPEQNLHLSYYKTMLVLKEIILKYKYC